MWDITMSMNNNKGKGHVPEQKEQQSAMSGGQGNWMDPGVIARMANKMYREFLEHFPESKGAVEMAMKSMNPSQVAPAGEMQHRQTSGESDPQKRAPSPMPGKEQSYYFMPDPARPAPKKPSPKADKQNYYFMPDPAPPAPKKPSPKADKQSYYFMPDPAPPATKKPSTGAFDVHTIRKDFPALHQKVHGKPLIWLDNAATTQKPQSVIDRIITYYERENSNIHRGAHTLATRATDSYEGSREKVRQFIGAGDSKEIIFVRGATEAINLVAQSYGRKFIHSGDEILITEMEHHANIIPWQMLCEATGALLRVAPISDIGEIEIDKFAALLNTKTRIVGVTHVSNVLGTVNPVKMISRMAHDVGARVVVDGAQSVPHMPVNVRDMDCDFFAFSGHKLFGPTGIGILYGKAELLEDMPPWEGGGEMVKTVTFDRTTYKELPHKFEAGTNNIAGAIGLGAAIDYLNRLDKKGASQHEQSVLEYAMDGLSRIPGLRIIGTSPGKVSVISFDLDGIDNEEVGRLLDREGIAVRATHHCAQPTLKRYNLPSAVRPSLAFYNTFEEIDALLAAIRKIQMRN
jgi:SufS family cysteine desulfurase